MDLDAATAVAVNQALQRRIKSLERTASMAPLMEAMQNNMQLMVSSVIPDVLAASKSRSSKSIINLEESLEEWPGKLDESRIRMESLLASARARTTALEAWLESLQ